MAEELENGLSVEDRENIKDIWEEGIKRFPAIRPLGIELIKVIKLRGLEAEGFTGDDKVVAAQNVFTSTLMTLIEEEANGTD